MTGTAVRTLTLVIVVLLYAVHPAARLPPFAARQLGDVVQLEDTETHTLVSIIPNVGNIAFAMTVNGHDVLRWPYSSIDEFKARPSLSGIPLLAPWANRLDEPAFFANGTRYAFDMTLGNVRGDIPIHGLLQTTNHWQVVDMDADSRSAWVTSRLEFFRYSSLMKQWPFAHTMEMTYRLGGGALEVAVAIGNVGAEPMPVAIGFHPYFKLTDSVRDDWTIGVGARTRWLLADNKLPTGATEPIERLFPNPKAAPLMAYNLDDVFSDLVRDGQGRATMSVIGKRQRLDITMGPNFKSVVIYSPAGRDFICFEPMAAITNALNLTQKGLYKDLQSIPPGGVWRESFRVTPHGF
jgi:aldose 1-epimerase